MLATHNILLIAMKTIPLILRWLALAAVVDWLLARTLTRLAIFMPKSPPVISVYQSLTMLGQLAATLSGLLAILVLSWLAWRVYRLERRLPLPVAWLALLALALVFLIIPPLGWIGFAYHLLLASALAATGWRALAGAGDNRVKSAILLATLALLAGRLYQFAPVFSEILQLSSPSAYPLAFFNAGELFATLTPLAFWWGYRLEARRGDWLLAALPVLAYIALRLANPAMAGIMAIWSTGLTLYLPWPLYALSLWLAGVTVLASSRQGEIVGLAILLLMAGGLSPQFSTHAFFGLVALALLVPNWAGLFDSARIPTAARALQAGLSFDRPGAH